MFDITEVVVKSRNWESHEPSFLGCGPSRAWRALRSQEGCLTLLENLCVARGPSPNGRLISLVFKGGSSSFPAFRSWFVWWGELEGG